MSCCGKDRGKMFWVKRAILIPIAVVVGVFVFGIVVMYLWNSILPGVLGVGTITFWQAIGILALAKILFGGCGMGRHRHHKCHGHRHKFSEKWMHLTPEEREQMRSDWRCKCGQNDKVE